VSEYRDTLERELGRLSPPRIPFDQLVGRRDRKRRNQRIRAGVLGLAIAVAAGLWGIQAIRSADVPAGHPKPSPDSVQRRDGEAIVFTVIPRESPGDLVAADPRTGKTRPLVQGLPLAYAARWSSDGRLVAYDTAPAVGGLWATDTRRGSNELVRGAVFPNEWAWSPADERIALIHNSELLVLDAVTGEKTDLGSVVGGALTPVWWPDGTRILYGAGRTGVVYSVDVASGTRSVFARLPGNNLGGVGQITWSRDGAHVAIVAGHGRLHNATVSGQHGDLSNLYVLDVDGSNTRVVVHDFEPGGGQPGEGAVSWSPDGTRLAYSERSHGQTRELSITTLALDGSTQPLVIRQHIGDCFLDGCFPVWSPDGSQIAFDTGGDGTLAVDADGNGDVHAVDELTYRSWNGGSYWCACIG
jgi:Tol biopolymer transport system component